MSGLVYLAGPISGQAYKGATEWREYATSILNPLGIQTASPLRFKSYLKDELDIADSYGKYVLSTPKAIYTRDRWDVLRSDVILANFVGAEKVSIGTVLELGWADGFEKPVVIAMEDGNIHQHAMVTEIAGYILPTLNEALLVVEALLNTGPQQVSAINTNNYPKGPMTVMR